MSLNETNLDSHYIFLPSNCNPHQYPNNVGSNYTVQLNKNLNFETPMECAIVSIFHPSYEKYLSTLSMNLSFCPSIIPMETKLWDFDENILQTFEIQTTSILKSDIINAYNETVNDIKNFFKNTFKKEYVFNELRKRGYLLDRDVKDWENFSIIKPSIQKINSTLQATVLTKGYFFPRNEDKDRFEFIIRFNDNLINLLGIETHFRIYSSSIFFFDVKKRKRLRIHYYSEEDLDLPINNINAKSEAKLNIRLFYHHFDSQVNPLVKENVEMRIFCDLVNQSYYNDSSMSILQEFHSNKTQSNHIFFKNLIYFPLRFNEIHSINVQILDFKFNPIKFVNGIVYICIHIRPIHYR